MTTATPAPRITPAGVTVPTALRHAASIALDGDAVLPVGRFVNGSFVAWPGGLAPRLGALGPTDIALLDHDGAVLASVEHDFGGADRWRRPSDAWGRRLSLDKWGWWTVQLVDRDTGERDRAVRDVQAVLDELSDQGRPAWIVGGTLLGAVRSADFIPHDDDVDLAYLASSSIPDEVARESFALERHLVDEGWQSRRFSAAHFQLRGADEGGRAPINVDVFSAFFRDGQINQPFHVRGPFRPDDLLPLTEVTLAGRRLPAPRNCDAWLTLNYGPGWRIPDSRHALETPRRVTRLFGGWFGHYQFQYEYWKDLGERTAGTSRPPSESAKWLARTLTPGTTIIEFGCGDGVDAAFLAGRGFPVLATDFTASVGALELPDRGMALARANVSDPRDLLRIAIGARRSGRQVHVHSRHLVDRLDPATRRIMLGALRHFPLGASFTMTVHVGRHDHLDARSPSMGRVSWRSIRRDSLAAGLRWRPKLVESEAGAGGTLLWGERTDMGHAIRRVRALPRTLREVRTEISEFRRVPLRLAEIEDLVLAELSTIGAGADGAAQNADSGGNDSDRT